MQLRSVTKAMLGALGTAVALLQVPDVAVYLKTVVAPHPHILSLVTGAITLAALLHNPEVQKAFGDEVETVTHKVVPIAEKPEDAA